MNAQARNLDPEIVVRLLPPWLRIEQDYAYKKPTGDYAHRLTQSFVPEFGFGYREGVPKIEYTNRLDRAFAYAQENNEETSLMSALSALKVLSVSQSLVVIYQRLVDGTPMEDISSMPSEEERKKVEHWVYDSLACVNPSERIDRDYAYSIVDEGSVKIQETVSNRDFHAGLAESKNLFERLAGFTVAYVSDNGYLPKPGVPTGVVEEWEFAKMVVGYPREQES